MQVPFDVPQASSVRIQQVFFALIEEILGDVKTPIPFNETRWGNLFYGSLVHYFGDLRSVYRFAATLQFHVGLFAGEEAFEVNTIDLICIETLRVFEPEVYSAMRAAKSLLTGAGAWRDDKAEKLEVERIIEATVGDYRPLVKQILLALFPKLESLYGNTYYDGSWLETWVHEARVCAPNKFDRYFLLSIPDDDLSESDLHRLLRSTVSYDGFMSEIDTLRDRDLLSAALEQLDHYKQKISLDHASEFLPAILDISDDLPEVGTMPFMTPSIHAFRILSWYLRQEEDPVTRGRYLRDAFQKAVGLSLIANVIDADNDRESKNEEGLLVDKKSRELLREEWLRRVSQFAHLETDLFMRNGSAAYLIFRWLDWGKADEIHHWAMRVFENPRSALRLLVALTSRGTTQSIRDSIARVVWRIDLNLLEKIAPISLIEKSVALVSYDGLAPQERRAIEAFAKAVKRRSEGKNGPIYDD